MTRILGVLLVSFLITNAACSRHRNDKELAIEIPSGFTGNFVLEMGVRGAAPLPIRGDSYVVNVPPSGRVITSTLLQKPRVTFKNASEGSIWGYSESEYSTGDGISIGGKVEFFVGTQKQYEADQNRKNHSGTSLTVDESASGA